jgi:hypothetical protein
VSAFELSECQESELSPAAKIGQYLLDYIMLEITTK